MARLRMVCQVLCYCCASCGTQPHFVAFDPREAAGLPASKPRATKRKKTERAEKSEKKKKKDKKGNLAIGTCWILCIWNCLEHVRFEFPIW